MKMPESLAAVYIYIYIYIVKSNNISLCKHRKTMLFS